MCGGYNTKEKSKFHVTSKRYYIPRESSMLADEKKSGQLNQAGEIAICSRRR
jgi:hypothetical protein